ncbi:MAG: hypothetical protein LBU87_00720 [Lactobacillales bacterium]|nr:hypothetical protein [Lactobacillales bacterium]
MCDSAKELPIGVVARLRTKNSDNLFFEKVFGTSGRTESADALELPKAEAVFKEYQKKYADATAYLVELRDIQNEIKSLLSTVLSHDPLILPEVKKRFSEEEYQKILSFIGSENSKIAPSFKEFLKSYYKIWDLRLKQADLAVYFYEIISGVPEEKIDHSKLVMVDMGEVAVSVPGAPKTLIGSWRGRDCFIVALYCPETKIGVVGHFDSSGDMTAFLNCMFDKFPKASAGKLQAHLLGGNGCVKEDFEVLRSRLLSEKVNLYTMQLEGPQDEQLILDVETGCIRQKFGLTALLKTGLISDDRAGSYGQKHFLWNLKHRPEQTVKVIYDARKEPLSIYDRNILTGYKQRKLERGR